MAESFSFVGFNGKNYAVPAFPDLSSEYEHYVLFASSNTTFADFTLFFYNDGFSFSSGDKVTCTSTPYVFQYSASSGLSGKWSVPWYNGRNGIQLVGKAVLVYSSPELLKFGDMLYSERDFLFDNSFIAKNTFVLRSIVEEQENIPNRVFGETFGILPILIVAFVGFIGIRKGINFLFGLLRSS